MAFRLRENFDFLEGKTNFDDKIKLFKEFNRLLKKLKTYVDTNLYKYSILSSELADESVVKYVRKNSSLYLGEIVFKFEDIKRYNRTRDILYDNPEYNAHITNEKVLNKILTLFHKLNHEVPIRDFVKYDGIRIIDMLFNSEPNSFYSNYSCDKFNHDKPHLHFFRLYFEFFILRFHSDCMQIDLSGTLNLCFDCLNVLNNHSYIKEYIFGKKFRNVQILMGSENLYGFLELLENIKTSELQLLIDFKTFDQCLVFDIIRKNKNIDQISISNKIVLNSQIVSYIDREDVSCDNYSDLLIKSEKPTFYSIEMNLMTEEEVGLFFIEMRENFKPAQMQLGLKLNLINWFEIILNSRNVFKDAEELSNFAMSKFYISYDVVEEYIETNQINPNYDTIIIEIKKLFESQIVKKFKKIDLSRNNLSVLYGDIIISFFKHLNNSLMYSNNYDCIIEKPINLYRSFVSIIDFSNNFLGGFLLPNGHYYPAYSKFNILKPETHNIDHYPFEIYAPSDHILNYLFEYLKHGGYLISLQLNNCLLDANIIQYLLSCIKNHKYLLDLGLNENYWGWQNIQLLNHMNIVHIFPNLLSLKIGLPIFNYLDLYIKNSILRIELFGVKKPKPQRTYRDNLKHRLTKFLYLNKIKLIEQLEQLTLPLSLISLELDNLSLFINDDDAIETIVSFVSNREELSEAIKTKYKNKIQRIDTNEININRQISVNLYNKVYELIFLKNQNNRIGLKYLSLNNTLHSIETIIFLHNITIKNHLNDINYINLGSIINNYDYKYFLIFNENTDISPFETEDDFNDYILDLYYQFLYYFERKHDFKNYNITLNSYPGSEYEIESRRPFTFFAGIENLFENLSPLNKSLTEKAMKDMIFNIKKYKGNISLFFGSDDKERLRHDQELRSEYNFRKNKFIENYIFKYLEKFQEEYVISNFAYFSPED